MKLKEYDLTIDFRSRKSIEESFKNVANLSCKLNKSDKGKDLIS